MAPSSRKVRTTWRASLVRDSGLERVQSMPYWARSPKLPLDRSDYPLEESLASIRLADELGFHACYAADETWHKDLWLLFAADGLGSATGQLVEGGEGLRDQGGFAERDR